MSNKSGRIGREWMNKIRDYMRDVYRDIEVAPDWGVNDKGDFTMSRPFCIEAKATKRLDISGALDEAEREARNAGCPFPVAWFKRRNHTIEKSIVCMTGETFKELCLGYDIREYS